jgi:hypothetical protein
VKFYGVDVWLDFGWPKDEEVAAVPWGDLEAHPTDYYDTERYSIPVALNSPAHLTNMQVLTLAEHLAHLTADPFVFRDKATILDRRRNRKVGQAMMGDADEDSAWDLGGSGDEDNRALEVENVVDQRITEDPVATVAAPPAPEAPCASEERVDNVVDQPVAEDPGKDGRGNKSPRLEEHVENVVDQSVAENKSSRRRGNVVSTRKLRTGRVCLNYSITVQY